MSLREWVLKDCRQWNHLKEAMHIFIPRISKAEYVVLILVLIPIYSSCIHLFTSFQSFLPCRIKFLSCLQILPLSAFPLINGSQRFYPPSFPLLCYCDGHLDDFPAFPPHCPLFSLIHPNTDTKLFS